MDFGWATSWRTEVGSSFTWGDGVPMSGDPNANAYIARHNVLSGMTMDAIQQAAVQTFFTQIKGAGTPNGSNLAPKLIDDLNSRLFLYCPVNDTTASFAAYALSINLAEGTFVNMVSGDLSVNGVTGGAGKYLNFGNSPSSFSASNYALGLYMRNTAGASGQVPMGIIESGVTKAAFLNPRNASGNLASAMNQTGTDGTSNTNASGFYISSRTTNTEYMIFKNGSLFATKTHNTTTASSLNTYGHANNSNTGVTNEDSRQLCTLFHCLGLTANEAEDLSFAINVFNTNCITGGRNTY